MIDRHLDKQALISLLRVCKSLYKLLRKCKIFTAWEWLANDPLAEGTMKLLEQLEARDSQFLLVKGFRRYKPGTDQRGTLNSLLPGRKNDSKLCTSLLRTDLTARLDQDAQFLLEHGADKEEWKSYKQHRHRGEDKRLFNCRRARLQGDAAARTALVSTLETAGRNGESLVGR
jgi:hypothetical protein